MHIKKSSNGFSLIEVIIVIAVIGLLTTLALPSYNRHTLKANRSDAFAALNEIMQAQERFAADNGFYTLNLPDIRYLATQPSERRLFNITASPCGASPIAQCVQLSATAIGGQAEDKNSDDGTSNIPITLNSRGDRNGWGN